MNLNDKRLGAYNKEIKKGSSPQDQTQKNPRPFTPEHISRSQSGNPGKTEQEKKKPEKTNTATAPATDGKIILPGLVKIQRDPDSQEQQDGTYRKVAKFLLLIGVDEAAKVMAQLTPEQVDKIVLEIASIRRVEPDEAEIILAEFQALLKQAREPSGGVATARSILETAFGAEKAEALLQKAVPNVHGKPFDYLEGIDPERIYLIISDELPAVKALVLSQLKPVEAAEVIKIMKPEEKKETVLRLAKLTEINPEVLRRVDEGMREKIQNINTSSANRVDGRSALAGILRKMDLTSEKMILDTLSDTDPELGKDLRERLFTIDDIIHSDNRFIQEYLRTLTEHDIAVLIAGKPENFREKILGNLSRTRSALVLDEEKIVVPVSRAESERVTSKFFSVMRRAWEKGEIYVEGRDDKTTWVQ
ncbi:flagellar motor switch protein FliG [Brucepastera parasyntrophica]|uniref:flagellar motor switch protein FliG n=1 Tax=Brucepastera parasyntrophica TaxID=2880008 RepID=UPI00210AB1BF|nr:flagellar motor switch protein FliG [Brucepastera parasyntrophica]ULQ60316.1 flagellar motor switch protein FliG [Brucepastera parasyntrophica]